ncbi:Golgi membrane protein 1 isoform X2 [Pseudophryne corroboree]
MMVMKAGRRGMKSPPLLIAVLLACVCVLGVHYWLTSTRCMELQNRVMELEGRMRRAAAERGAVEMKKNEFEDMLAVQKKQIENIQTLHSSQLQNMNTLCSSEKENLLNNLTAKDGFVHELQVEISRLHKRLEDSKLEFKELQDSQAKKSAFELTQCSIKITEMNEQCEEKLRRLSSKDPNTVNVDTEKSITNFEKLKPTLSKQDSKSEYSNVKEGGVLPGPPSHPEATLQLVVPQAENEEKSNKLDALTEKKTSSAPQQNKLQEQDEDVLETQNEVNPENVNAEEEDDEPKVEDTADKDANKKTENEDVEREDFINMEEEKGTNLINQGEVENQNDYNGDDANEAEPETDKQAELIDNDQNLKDDTIPNEALAQALEIEPEDIDDPTLK